MMLAIRSLAFWFLLSSLGFAQTANTVIGMGYSSPVPITVAPGQILNLFVQGIGGSLTQRVAATSLPLPTSLADISVQLLQSAAPQSVAVPLLAVRSVSTCLNGTSLGSATCGEYTVVTVQVPYELVPNCQAVTQVCPSSATPFINIAQLIVSDAGVSGNAIALNPLVDQIHIANLCDIDTSAPLACGSAPVITHADGSLISVSSPAIPGEEIVIYALGLGATNPAVPTGQVTPSPAPLAINLNKVNFEYGANEGPSKGVPLSLTVCSTIPTCPFIPRFAGLTPTSVGLYQINFVIPQSAQGIVACGPGITSNLTLTIVGLTSFDGAGICVAPSHSGSTGSSDTLPIPAFGHPF